MAGGVIGSLLYTLVLARNWQLTKESSSNNGTENTQESSV